MFKPEVGDTVVRRRDGTEVTVTDTWYDRNAECPSVTVVPIIAVKDASGERELMVLKEIERKGTTDKLAVPTLRRGKAFVGPEAFGCCNTGTRPIILHSKATGLWLVGPELAVDEARSAVCFGAERGKRTLVRMGKTVHIYKTRGPAVKRFQDNVDEQRAMNERLKASYDAAADDARSADPETAIAGALALSD